MEQNAISKASLQHFLTAAPGSSFFGINLLVERFFALHI